MIEDILYNNHRSVDVYSTGNITSRAPDAMIRALLGACGPVLSWKRVSTFGFCEFASPEAALRCVRLLHERALGDKKLLARTDGKMQALVDTYKSEYIAAVVIILRSRSSYFCYIQGYHRTIIIIIPSSFINKTPELYNIR